MRFYMDFTVLSQLHKRFKRRVGSENRSQQQQLQGLSYSLLLVVHTRCEKLRNKIYNGRISTNIQID